MTTYFFGRCAFLGVPGLVNGGMLVCSKSFMLSTLHFDQDLMHCDICSNYSATLILWYAAVEVTLPRYTQPLLPSYIQSLQIGYIHSL